MSKIIFVVNEKLTKQYQRYFNEPGSVGYYASPSELNPEEKYYCLFLEKTDKKILLGGTEKSVSMRIDDMYFIQRWDFLKPYSSLAEMEREINKTKRSQKRLDLIKQVSMIKTWGRGVIAKIAANLGRTVGAVRSMLSVLNKVGLLVRVRRGQYSVA
ncbi:hypothetical protein THIOM_000256 [Candidatus Thiomargarita nelsonii]|uniref:Uncharacterized protein n=1 Tax=Candidatus Thiomargarita nelsonii TaxID=1003181 RepID=A0A176S7B3_9GAMM|nr:hypothetical protein THIOM_000256 [Candidatus Thiomargarita nelsonii]